ncbi:MAG TPA: efflux RND transporter periplasmic adaptor subunit [Thermoanaerobaculia bacterium]|nr:efflux RND transporter periplasmic adaptor subunit [Thermoanaerobaculia bacterium]
MKKKSVIATVLLVVVAIAGVLIHRAAFAKETTTYRFTSIERGNLESAVSATGTLSAVTTVSVGTQVSGQISELRVDFNDSVKKGQLLARIDPKLQLQAVTDAQASLAKARAQYLQAQRDAHRSSELLEAGLLARSEYEASDSSLDVARANVTSAQVSLDRARQNLEYTNIYAPIDGVVVERNVDNGQTVAASLSAPQLFLIANDLRDMQILASVGEGDIASIKEGQKVKFTVAALQGQTFDGTVKQVRLQSKTNENVVNYTVAVSVANPQKKLLPGMTARVDFLTNTAENVLKVANSALRFKPADGVEVVKKERPQNAQQRQPRTTTRTRSGGMGTLYVLNAEGKLEAVRVRTGISDGSATEIRGRDLKEGTRVVAGTSAAQTADAKSATPFQQNSGSQQRGQRGGF